ncbi:MAG: hypothetical protein GKR89_19955 [Candidatus Latescibacteria bacterium]|nr:hypothetical protein [Candidatus Latescibacterota bacterium]
MSNYTTLLALGTFLLPTLTYAVEDPWFTSGPDVRFGIIAIAADWHQPGVLYAGANMKTLYKSTDAGGSWSPLWDSGITGSVTHHVTDIATDPHTPNTVYVGISNHGFSHIIGGIHKSIDGGITWAVSNKGLPSPSVSMLVADPQKPDGLYTAAEGGLYRSVDGAESWQLVLPDGGHVAVYSGDSQIVYATGPSWGLENTLWQSVDGGTNWTQVATGMPGLIQIDPQNPAVLYLAGGVSQEGRLVGTILKSPDSGLTWEPIFELPGGWIGSFAIDPQNPAVLYAGSGGKVHKSGVFRSTDGGSTWTEIHAAGPLDLLLDPFDHTTLYAGMNSLAWGVFRTRFGVDITAVQSVTWGQVKTRSKP